jgi:phosphoglucosamine mutase
MTNGGLEATLARDGIALIRTQVGDRYVWEELDKRKAQFGGEPSGHVIFREFTTTGDGILTALEVLSLMRSERRTLVELAREIERWPQITKNVKAPRRREWKDVTSFSSAVRDAEAELGTAGRLVVRPSGTEPVLRITVEARDDAVARRIADALAAEATQALA